MSAISNRQKNQVPVVRLLPDIRRIVASIIFLIRQGADQKIELTQYDIVKSLFLADKSHLNKYGRPITFDNYVAMRHGPVPSVAYDLLKETPAAMRHYNLTTLPWQKVPAEHIGDGCYSYHHASGDDINEFLSTSDQEALSGALATVNALTFGQIRELTHNDASYKEAWNRSESQSNPMSIGLLFDTANFEAAEEIEFLSNCRSSEDVDLDEVSFDDVAGDNSSRLRT
jgi:uncharacterized phage-associated protein